MGKYNVGDVVDIRCDLEPNHSYGAMILHSGSMSFDLIGATITIKAIREDGFYLTTSGWNISEQMIEGIHDPAEEVVKNRRSYLEQI